MQRARESELARLAHSPQLHWSAPATTHATHAVVLVASLPTTCRQLPHPHARSPPTAPTQAAHSPIWALELVFLAHRLLQLQGWKVDEHVRQPARMAGTVVTPEEMHW